MSAWHPKAEVAKRGLELPNLANKRHFSTPWPGLGLEGVGQAPFSLITVISPWQIQARRQGEITVIKEKGAKPSGESARHLGIGHHAINRGARVLGRIG